MLAIEILRDFEARGFSIGIIDGDRLSIAPSSLLTDADRKVIRAFKTEIMWRLRHLGGDPDQPERIRRTDPHINEQRDLVIPFDCNPKYKYWQGGQSIWATLKELNAPEPIMRRYVCGRGESDY